MRNLFRLRKDRSGATAIEYALIIALISVAIVGALHAVGTNLNDIFQLISNTMADAVANAEIR
jgi:pilus assembly protein Flp/PilA